MSAAPLSEARVTELCEQAFGQLYGVMNMSLVLKFAELIAAEVLSPSYWDLPEQWLTEEDDSAYPEVFAAEPHDPQPDEMGAA